MSKIDQLVDKMVQFHKDSLWPNHFNTTDYHQRCTLRVYCGSRNCETGCMSNNMSLISENQYVTLDSR